MALPLAFKPPTLPPFLSSPSPSSRRSDPPRRNPLQGSTERTSSEPCHRLEGQYYGRRARPSGPRGTLKHSLPRQRWGTMGIIGFGDHQMTTRAQTQPRLPQGSASPHAFIPNFPESGLFFGKADLIGSPYPPPPMPTVSRGGHTGLLTLAALRLCVKYLRTIGRTHHTVLPGD